MTPVAVVFAALGWEARPVLEAIASPRPDPLPGFRSWIGSAAGRPVRVVQTGVGRARARAAAAAAGGGGARWFVSTGCAGGLDAALVPGALVVATRVLDQDGRAVGACMAAVAEQLQRWAGPRGLRLHAGCIYTADTPLRSAAEKAAAHNLHGAIAIEMEGGAIAAAAAAREARFLSVRAILDPAGLSLPAFDGAVDAVSGAVQLGALVAHVARHPAALGAAGRLVLLQRTAAGELRRFFRAFVREDGLGALEAGGGRAHPASAGA